jgi:hypothetical protein
LKVKEIEFACTQTVTSTGSRMSIAAANSPNACLPNLQIATCDVKTSGCIRSRSPLLEANQSLNHTTKSIVQRWKLRDDRSLFRGTPHHPNTVHHHIQMLLRSRRYIHYTCLRSLSNLFKILLYAFETISRSILPSLGQPQ